MSSDFASVGRSTQSSTHPKPNSDWEKHRAARVVAGNAHTVDECTEFLNMLGLTAKDGKTVQAGKAPVFNPYGGAKREQT